MNKKILVLDVYNTLLFGPTPTDSEAYLDTLFQADEISLHARKWMANGLSIALIADLAGLSIPKFRDHCLVDSYQSLRDLRDRFLDEAECSNEILDKLEAFNCFLNQGVKFPFGEDLLHLANTESAIFFLSNANSFQSDPVRLLLGSVPNSQLMLSCELGRKKPDPLLLLEILDRYNAQPKDMICIGDSVTSDIEPARQLGIETVLVSSVNTFGQWKRGYI